MTLLRALPMAALLAAAAALPGCSDDPNSSGRLLLPDSLAVVEATAFATSDSTYRERIGGNQQILLVGAAQGAEARAVLRFSFAAFDTTSRIDSAILVLRPGTLLPDSGGAAAFTVHEMTASWSAASFRWDSVPGSFNASASGSFAGSVGGSDTILRVRLDTSLARAWLRAGTGSAMLVPAAGGATVIGFNGPIQVVAGLQPVLEISTRGAADTTVRISRNAVEGVFVADGAVPSQPGLAVLQGGIAWRALIRFDSLSLPPDVGIAQAFIEIRPNPGLPPGPGASRDTLSVSFVQDRAFPLDSLVLSGFVLPADEHGSKVYRADIRTYLQLWNTREPNAGIVLRAIGEAGTLDRFGLYGSAAADSVRPRIRVTYTRFP